MTPFRFLLLCSLFFLLSACGGPEPSGSDFSGDIAMIGARDPRTVKDADPITITLDLPDGGRMKWETKWASAKHLDPADVIIKRKGDTRVAVFRDGEQIKKSPFLTQDINRDQYWKPTANYGSPIAGMSPQQAHEKLGNEKVAEAQQSFYAGNYKLSLEQLQSAKFHFERAYPARHPRLAELDTQIQAVKARIRE